MLEKDICRYNLDGIDLDIEGGSSVGYGSFFKKLRDLMNADNSKEYVLSPAPLITTLIVCIGSSYIQTHEAAKDFTWMNKWDSAANAAGHEIQVPL